MNRWKLTKQLSKSFSAGSVVALLTIAHAMADNPNDVIRFNAIQPTGIASNLTDTWYIYGAGTIDQHAAVRLKALVASKKIPQGSLLFLDSLGGDLLGGMALGREIRASGLLTYVNGANGMTKYGTPASKPAVCASACTLAFLGGRFRYIDEKSIFAVHRFYFRKKGTNDADTAQIVSSAIVQYMRDMGVDPQLFTLTTGAGQAEAIIPTREQLLALNVVNNGQEKPIWSIESVPQGLYLKGAHNTVWGDNKLTFTCAKTGFLALTAFFPSRGQDSLIAIQKASGLLLDGQVLRIPNERVVGPTLLNGTAMVVLVLNRQDVDRLLNSHTVGVSLQIAYDAETFSGIADFDFSDGLKKIGGFMSSCH